MNWAIRLGGPEDLVRRAGSLAAVALILALAGCSERGLEAPVELPPATAAVLPAGTQIEIGLDRSLSTAADHIGATFTATLGVPISVEGHEIFPAGTRVRGHVTTSRAAGQGGRAALGITLDSLEYRGNTVLLHVELVGGGAGLGAILKGPGDKETRQSGAGQIEIPVDTMFLFRLTEAVSLAP